MLGQSGIHTASDGNQGHALSFENWQDGHQFVAFTTVGNGQNHVHCFDHAQIAMTGLAGVHEHGGCAGRGQCGRNFGADVTALAHARDHHTTFDLKHHLNGRGKAVVQSRFEKDEGRSLDVQSLASELNGLF